MLDRAGTLRLICRLLAQCMIYQQIYQPWPSARLITLNSTMIISEKPRPIIV